MARRTDATKQTETPDPFETPTAAAVASVPNASPPPETPPAPPALTDTLHEQPLKLPLVRETVGYLSRHVEVNGLTERQVQALGRLRLGLIAADARLENRKPVSSNADVVRYILEQITV